jgi:hypothetical protein
MKELVVQGENRAGLLAEVAEAVGNSGINIEAIIAYPSSGGATMRIITSDPTSAIRGLNRVRGISVQQSDIILAEIQDKPGELGKIARRLSDRGADLEVMYIAGRGEGKVRVAIKPAPGHVEIATHALTKR